MDTDEVCDIARRGVNRRRQAEHCCQAVCAQGTVCEYGRTCHSSNVGRHADHTVNELVRYNKYLCPDHKVCSLAKSRHRGDSLKSKFRRRIMKTDIIFLALLCCLLVCEARSSTKGTHPRLNGKGRVKVTATVGQYIVLPCPVTADPPPLTKWSVNGQPIVGIKTKFKVGFDLRIRDVRESDEGTYRCTARNAFGMVEHEIKLVVRDQGEVRSPSKPRFTMASRMRRQNIARPVNRSLRLRCRASGYPVPEVEWYKDGNLTRTPKSGRHPDWSFHIRKLKPSDSGHYRCRVWNSEGEINYTYEVQVIEQLRERPVLLEPHPMNTTVQVGGMTAIQCRVQSRVEPTVKWIKRLDDNTVAPFDEDLPTNIITIDDRHYMILPTQEMLHLENGLYLNKLVIRGATEKHAGMYICLAANTMGYNFKYAYLRVLTGPVNSSHRSTSSPRTKILPGSRSGQQGSLSLPAIIGVPAGIGLLMVVFLAWFCQRKREQSLKSASANVVVSGSDRLSALGSSETKSSTRSTPVPQECDQHEEDNNNKENALDCDAEQQTLRRNNENYYILNHRPPPTAGTPLLTVNEPDDSEFEVPPTDDDGYHIPAPPPCSEAASSYRSPTENRLGFKLGPPPPPPPSQKSASSLSSYPDARSQYSHHYHYMHPPGGSRRHHHHHGHHSRNGHNHYGY